MKLLILRHGDADPHASSDDLRPLSSRGRADVEAVVQHMARSFPEVGIVFVSPLLRAQQTAAIVTQTIVAQTIATPHTVTVEQLIPEGRPDDVYQLLASRREPSIVLVSHLPLVGTLVNQLCGKENNFYRMGTANLACIDCEIAAKGCGELEWLVTPGDLL